MQRDGRLAALPRSSVGVGHAPDDLYNSETVIIAAVPRLGFDVESASDDTNCTETVVMAAASR